jgi:hypothetical protein
MTTPNICYLPAAAAEIALEHDWDDDSIISLLMDVIRNNVHANIAEADEAVTAWFANQADEKNDD